jgi:predicted dehydrogenase
MTGFSRRSMLASATATTCLSLAGTRGFGSPISDRLNVAMIGCGGRAKGLLNDFQKIANVSWVCDPDQKRLEQFAEQAKCKNKTSDLREVLADSKVHAVVIATPDHWHAPAAILACNAKKHVYVEKPCSHNFAEGKMLVAAARKNQVVVQHGTQSRSNRMIVNAIQLLKEGIIGDVLMAKAWNVQRRDNIGKSTPTTPPPHVDYDTWVGPAEFMPYQENRFHYSWHWWHNFGTGDIGNDGAHEMDIACWGLGVEGLPSSVNATGGKYYFDDDQQFPDNALCTFEWPGDGKVGKRKQLVFDMRIWSKNYPYNCDTGVEFYGTHGMLVVSKRGKLLLWNEDNKQVDVPKPKQEPPLEMSHQADFIQAILQSRRPNADIEIGHQSVSLIHLANASLRIGRSLRIDPKNQVVLDDPEANKLCGRTYRKEGHWGVPVATV